LPSSDEVRNESRSDVFVSKQNARFLAKEGWPLRSNRTVPTRH